MCLAVFAIDRHARLPLVIVSNRDEYHDRPTAPVDWWESGILAGRDLRAGGSWFGITARGHWALVTNYREGGKRTAGAPSRGTLVPRVLGGNDPLSAARSLVAELAAFDGCNLVAGELGRAIYVSNRTAAPRRIGGGVHGLSNGVIDSPWPKLARVRDRLSAWLAAESSDIEPLFEALGDREPAPDHALPSTGVPLAWERVLSSPFIVGDAYGTRCSTVVTVDRDGAATLVERRFAPGGTRDGETRIEFRIG